MSSQVQAASLRLWPAKHQVGAGLRRSVEAEGKEHSHRWPQMFLMPIFFMHLMICGNVCSEMRKQIFENKNRFFKVQGCQLSHFKISKGSTGHMSCFYCFESGCFTRSRTCRSRSFLCGQSTTLGCGSKLSAPKRSVCVLLVTSTDIYRPTFIFAQS